MSTVALEFVPPDLENGHQLAQEEAGKITELFRETGLEGRVNSLLVPGMIAEDPDRPVALRPKMDPLDLWKAVKPQLGNMTCMVTQVTAFHKEAALTERFAALRSAGIDHVVMVGVPRTMADGEGDGVPPTDALDRFREQVPNRGVICIPTRDQEHGRFNFKCERGATFSLSQLLFSTAMVDFLKAFAEKTPHRPHMFLSFGYVPQAETRVGLTKWLIKDDGNPLVDQEIAFVNELAGMELKPRRAALLELYKIGRAHV